ncbi:hypothetical protein [Accumulibacter sp.]|uniref:DUF1016 N-terminal domain-containing protein n=1 Tax=Accumulibacter sp. TaxID=2053492 RepID=UPI0025D81BE1|nr:hypothetical protein [Accumulibacter sp.]
MNAGKRLIFRHISIDTQADDLIRSIGAAINWDKGRPNPGLRTPRTQQRRPRDFHHRLATEYGRGFEEEKPSRMVQFAEAFPDEPIVATLWRHHRAGRIFRERLPLQPPRRHAFYAEMCRIAGWGTNTPSKSLKQR